MKKAITYGTFDMFHIGHLKLLRRIRENCDYLVVGVSTDEFNKSKGKRAFTPFLDRFQIVEACRYVDEVIPEESWDQKVGDIIREGIDLFVIGEDWKGKFDALSEFCEVIYLPRTPGISSTLLRRIRSDEDDS